MRILRTADEGRKNLAIIPIHIDGEVGHLYAHERDLVEVDDVRSDQLEYHMATLYMDPHSSAAGRLSAKALFVQEHENVLAIGRPPQLCHVLMHPGSLWWRAPALDVLQVTFEILFPIGQEC